MTTTTDYPFNHLIDNNDFRTVHLSDGGAQVIKNCFDQLVKIAGTFGYGSEEYRVGAESLGNCLPHVLGRRAFGAGALITPHWPETEDGLSLYIRESSGFECGMVWFPKRGVHADLAGIAGEWSLHS